MSDENFLNIIIAGVKAIERDKFKKLLNNARLKVSNGTTDTYSKEAVENRINAIYINVLEMEE